MTTTTHSHKHWTDEGGHVNAIQTSTRSVMTHRLSLIPKTLRRSSRVPPRNEPVYPATAPGSRRNT